uniref:Uncharacterized protein n=1 Tax=Mesocestoides corti TaxID=53468 RepID=A0A5K3FI01_MESCO
MSGARSTKKFRCTDAEAQSARDRTLAPEQEHNTRTFRRPQTHSMEPHMHMVSVALTANQISSVLKDEWANQKGAVDLPTLCVTRHSTQARRFGLFFVLLSLPTLSPSSRHARETEGNTDPPHGHPFLLL